MKIFYAVQATGNGHIARAIELIPLISEYGKVDVFLSGSNFHLQKGLPVTFSSKGISLFYHPNGGLDYVKMFRNFSLKEINATATRLPLEDYDLIINDFEAITSLACKRKAIQSIGFGHQASFQSPKSPRPPKREWVGEWVLKKYAPATKYIGLHFKKYDHNIYPPIIKKSILEAHASNNGHVSVYLPHFSDRIIDNYLEMQKDVSFEVFSKTVKQESRQKNILWRPISNENFTRSMITAEGIITGAGFETPAEALYLGKKLLCIPISGQYEQSCNAAALKELGVTIAKTLNHDFTELFKVWMHRPSPKKLELSETAEQIVRRVVETGLSVSK